MQNMASPTLYFLVNKEGKFYNAKDKHFYTSIVNGNYEKRAQGLELMIKTLPAFKDCAVHTMTEDDLFDAYCVTTTHAVLAGAYCAAKLVEVDHRLPTVSQVNKNMHKKLTHAIQVLEPFTSYLKDFVKKEEEITDNLMGDLGEFIYKMSAISINDMRDFNTVIDGYNADKKSVLGIAKKVAK